MTEGMTEAQRAGRTRDCLRCDRMDDDVDNTPMTPADERDWHREAGL